MCVQNKNNARVKYRNNHASLDMINVQVFFNILCTLHLALARPILFNHNMCEANYFESLTYAQDMHFCYPVLKSCIAYCVASKTTNFYRGLSVKITF